MHETYDRKIAADHPHGSERALLVPGAHVHTSGKAMSGPGREMDHITSLGMTLKEALATARRAANLIRFGKAKL